MLEYGFNLVNNITNLIEHYGYIMIIIFMVIESSFLPFPSEIIMIPAGYLAYQGSLNFLLVILSGTFGSIIGALLNYYLARKLGIKFITNYGKYLFISEKSLQRVEQFFTKHGAISTFTGRLIPLVRQYISFPAGLSKMNLNKFIFFTFFGSIMWMFSLTIIGYIFGQNRDLISANLHDITMLTLLFVAKIILIYILWLRLRKLTLNKL